MRKSTNRYHGMLSGRAVLVFPDSGYVLTGDVRKSEMEEMYIHEPLSVPVNPGELENDRIMVDRGFSLSMALGDVNLSSLGDPGVSEMVTKTVQESEQRVPAKPVPIRLLRINKEGI